MPSLRRLYDRLLRPKGKDRQTKQGDINKQGDILVRSVAQQDENTEANLVHEAPEPQPGQVQEPPRVDVPKIQVRRPTPRIYENGVPQSPSLRSLATIRLRRRNSSHSEQSRSDSKASSSTGFWLKEQLYEARVECTHPAHCFIVPRSVQEKLITVAAVSKDIQAGNPDIDEHFALEYAEKACTYARQLYATLAYIKKGADICLLLEEGVTDADLPFVRKPNASSRFALYRNNGDPIKTLESWRNKYLENFDRFQWWMTAPVFRLHEEIYKLDDKTVLPFLPLAVDGDELETKQGGYSEVYPVRIHPAHHEFWETTGRAEDEPLVAVKRLFNSDETEFLKEAMILNAVGLNNHPHLIKLLATYKYEGKYHLMFPYANANLRKYWDDRPSPEFNRENVLWSLRQMTGIANGLLRIHTFTVTYPLRVTAGAGSVRMPRDVKLMVERGEEWFGRHGDIKPENVLWFEHDRVTDDPMGALQIADFGLGRFHGRESRSGVNPETVQSSPTYEPPECKLRQPVSRAYDMWSLGCLFLELLTWLLKGSQEIEGFSEFRGREATGTGIDDDNFFTLVNDGDGMHAIVRESVVTWKNQLHAHEKCSQLIHDLLELTMMDLLVTDTKKRCQASWLFQKLKMYLHKAEVDDDYMLKPVPWPAKPGSVVSMGQPVVPSFASRRNAETAKPATRTRNLSTKDVVHGNLPKDLVFRHAFAPTLRRRSSSRATWPVGTR